MHTSLLLFLCAFNVVVSFPNTENYLIETTTAISQQGTSCKNHQRCIDCSTLQICAVGANDTLKPIENIACSGENPYCDSSIGSCVSYTPEDCGKPVKEACFSDGVYPDLSNCRKYFVCSNEEARTYSCGKGFYFDVKTKTCMESASAECASVTCTNNHGRRIPLVNNEYFAYCANSKVKMVGKCNPGEKFNVTLQECVVQADTIHEKYYLCYYSYNAYYKISKDCNDWEPLFPFNVEEQYITNVPGSVFRKN